MDAAQKENPVRGAAREAQFSREAQFPESNKEAPGCVSTVEKTMAPG